MAFNNNVYQSVATLNSVNLGLLSNKFLLPMLTNRQFDEFNTKYSANIGNTVRFRLPPRFSNVNSIVWAPQPVVNRFRDLSVNCENSISVEVDDKQRIFFDSKSPITKDEIDYYTEYYGNPMALTTGTRIEQNLSGNFISAVLLKDGTIDRTPGPFRFYGDGLNPINSPLQLAKMAANFRAFGDIGDLVCVIPAQKEPDIINGMLSQFAPDRNNQVATSYKIGTLNPSGVTYYRSYNLPIHSAGAVANLGQTLTLVSTNDPTGYNVTQITFSGATNNQVLAIKAGDLISFNVTTNQSLSPYFLTFNGDAPTTLPLQVRAITNSNANGSGQVTVTVSRPIGWNGITLGETIKISTPLVSGMTANVARDHIAGCIYNKNAFFFANPRLPSVDPFYSDSRYDEDTRISLRFDYGAQLGESTLKFGYSTIWGSHLVDEYSARVCFPING